MTRQPLANIDPQLVEAAAEIEARESGVRVIAARLFKIPLVQVRLNAIVQAPRRFNILEEFVLRAGSDLAPAPTREEIASLLGLDRLFVDATCQELERLGVIQPGAGSAIQLTANGKQYYIQGQVPTPPERKALDLAYCPVTDSLRVNKRAATVAEDVPYFPGVSENDLAKWCSLAQSAGSQLKRVIDTLQHSTLRLHAPAEGRRVIEIERASIGTIDFYNCGVLAVQDPHVAAGADHVSVRVQSVPRDETDTTLQKLVEDQLRQGRINLADLAPPAKE